MGIGNLLGKFVSSLLEGQGTSAASTGAGLAVIYCGSDPVERDCARDAAAVVAHVRPDLTIVQAGPGANVELTADLISRSTLYVQPGGKTLKPAYKKLKHLREPLRQHLASGGTYLGICLGGYLAGKTPGFDLLPGDTDQYIATDNATIDHDEDAVVTVTWRGQEREMYFQDGPVFDVDESKVTVLARYLNGTIAALSTPFGRGTVVVCGPHPEATGEWFQGINRSLTEGPGPAIDLAADLVRTAAG